MEISLERVEEGVKVIKTTVPEPVVDKELLNDDQLLESLKNIKTQIEEKKPVLLEVKELEAHKAAIEDFIKSEELLVPEETVKEVLEEVNQEQ